jgi:alpha-beta hydrolase superfamily lysophospholipase
MQEICGSERHYAVVLLTVQRHLKTQQCFPVFRWSVRVNFVASYPHFVASYPHFAASRNWCHQTQSFEMDPISAASFNKPKTGNAFTNFNGCKLHFRVQWDKFKEAKRAIFYVPGYSNHINRPEFFAFANYMNAHNTVIIAVDMQGHGYSDGKRCLLMSHADLLEDVTQLVDGFMNVNTSECFRFDTVDGSFQTKHLSMLQKLPFFIMGSSMGGAITTMVAQRLHSDKATYPTFKGAILLAPALSFDTPHWLLMDILR